MLWLSVMTYGLIVGLRMSADLSVFLLQIRITASVNSCDAKCSQESILHFHVVYLSCPGV